MAWRLIWKKEGCFITQIGPRSTSQGLGALLMPYPLQITKEKKLLTLPKDLNQQRQITDSNRSGTKTTRIHH